MGTSEQVGRGGTGHAAALAVVLIVAQDILYGFGDPISKIAYESLSVFSLLTVRYLIATVVLLAAGGRRAIAQLRRVRVRDWLVPSVCIAGGYVVSNVALSMSAATSFAFIRSLPVVMAPLLAFAVYRTPYDRRHLPVLVALVVGLYLLCGMGGLTGFGFGETLAFASCLLSAGALVFGARTLQDIDALALTCAQAATSFVMALSCALAFEGGLSYEAATPQVWGIIVYLALACTLAGYLLQNAALRRAPASAVAVAQCLYPVATAVFSFALLGEHLTTAGLIGAAIIVAGVAADTLVGSKDEGR